MLTWFTLINQRHIAASLLKYFLVQCRVLIFRLLSEQLQFTALQSTSPHFRSGLRRFPSHL